MVASMLNIENLQISPSYYIYNDTQNELASKLNQTDVERKT